LISKSTNPENTKPITRLTRNSKLYKTIIKAIQEKKGSKIVALDLKKILEASADYFIICEANSTTQVKAIADNVQEIVRKELGELPYKHEGYTAQKWVLIDYVTVVVHVMQPEARSFYQLEEMWHDAPSVEYND
jgi:ribosome-associated protein